MKRHRLTTAQRLVLGTLLEHGGTMPMVSGYRYTRVGHFNALGKDGIATNSVTMSFLRFHKYIEPVEGVPHHYGLTATGLSAIRRARAK
mgnify:CR=1 FL=1